MKNRVSLLSSILLSFSLFLVLISCQKNSSESFDSSIVDSTAIGQVSDPLFETDNDLSMSMNTAPITVIKSITSTRKNLLLESTFESSFSEWKNSQHCCSYSTGMSSSYAKSGSKSMRVELRKSDPDVASSKRAELTQDPLSSATIERWYGTSFYFPSDYVADNTGCSEIIFQWHQVNTSGPPPLSIWVSGSSIMINQYNLSTKKDALTKLTSLVTNKWISMVFHVKWSPTSSGLVEAWVNGTKVYTKSGVNNYKESIGNYVKTGIYKWGWKNGYASKVSKRVLYQDDIRIGNEKATYNDVAP